jgi:glycosyltransferase involved in cell wall biosynthesis
MKVAQIVCSTKTGLGIQGKSFYDNFHPDSVMVVDIGELNGYEQHPEWYPDGYFVKGLQLDDEIRHFIDGQKMDIIFVTESAYSFYVYDYARYRNVRVINQQNYEFNDYIANPQMTPRPDAFISPSMWHYDDVQNYCDRYNIPHTYLHCPVDRKQFPFREIRQAKTFIHSGGRSAIHDRAGTYGVIDASRYVKSNVKIIVHFQGNQGLAHQLTSTTNDYVEYAKKYGDMNKLEFVMKDFENQADIYQLGDVYIMPRRYGGNNLPMGEALSSGLPVIMTNISPNRDFLPSYWLIPAKKIDTFTPRTTIDIYEADVKELAKKIDEFATVDSADMLRENKKADFLAESISWTSLLPRYRSFFEGVINHKA